MWHLHRFLTARQLRHEADELLRDNTVAELLGLATQVCRKQLLAALRGSGSERAVLMGSTVSPAWLFVSMPERVSWHKCPFCLCRGAGQLAAHRLGM